MTRPENIVRAGGETGQPGLFDNRVTQHYAIANYHGRDRRQAP